MASNWPSSFFGCLWTGYLKCAKKHNDANIQPSWPNKFDQKRFIIWRKNTISSRDTASNPERVANHTGRIVHGLQGLKKCFPLKYRSYQVKAVLEARFIWYFSLNERPQCSQLVNRKDDYVPLSRLSIRGARNDVYLHFSNVSVGKGVVIVYHENNSTFTPTTACIGMKGWKKTKLIQLLTRYHWRWLKDNLTYLTFYCMNKREGKSQRADV